VQEGTPSRARGGFLCMQSHDLGRVVRCELQAGIYTHRFGKHDLHSSRLVHAHGFLVPTCSLRQSQQPHCLPGGLHPPQLRRRDLWREVSGKVRPGLQREPCEASVRCCCGHDGGSRIHRQKDRPAGHCARCGAHLPGK
ncbi:unnamed protein product, partial [Polarella glacialis]